MQQKPNTIPPFDERGNLPSGIHKATIDEVVERFGNPKSLKRNTLVKHLKEFYGFASPYAVTIYIDGSFVTSKLAPGDVDIVMIISNKLRFDIAFQRRLKEIQNDHARNKLHIFVCFETDLDRETQMLEWFTTTRKDDHNNQFPKGIICLETKS